MTTTTSTGTKSHAAASNSDMMPTVSLSLFLFQTSRSPCQNLAGSTCQGVSLIGGADWRPIWHHVTADSTWHPTLKQVENKHSQCWLTMLTTTTDASTLLLRLKIGKLEHCQLERDVFPRSDSSGRSAEQRLCDAGEASPLEPIGSLVPLIGSLWMSWIKCSSNHLSFRCPSLRSRAKETRSNCPVLH